MNSEEIRQKLGLLPWDEHAANARATGRFPPGRAEGQTTRMLCDALSAVSQGKRVKIAAFRIDYARRITAEAREDAVRLGLASGLIADCVSHEDVERLKLDRGMNGVDRPFVFSDHHRERKVDQPDLTPGVWRG